MPGLKVNDCLRIMACGTGCLCIVIAVATAMIILAKHPDEHTARIFGSFSQGAATGVIAMLGLMVYLVKVSLGRK